MTTTPDTALVLQDLPELVVLCPFCGQRHTHHRQSIGSRRVVAGCSRGYQQYREYSIPKGPK